MKFLLDADDDWIETYRQFCYPKLHPILSGIGPFYAVGTVGKDQHVGNFDVNEETFEEILVDLGFERNPIACLKTDNHDHLSEGSWVLRSHDDTFDLLDKDRQLHVTIFNGKGGNPLEVYAHNEYDWQDAPWKHLRGKDFRPVEGCTQMEQILDHHTYLDSLNAGGKK